MIEAKLYKGDYSERCQAANRDGASLYLEQHFNASTFHNVNYAYAIHNGVGFAQEAAEFYVESIHRYFPSVKIRQPDDMHKVHRGYGNIRRCEMPALLLEPCFITNRLGLDIAISEYETLGDIIISLAENFLRPGQLLALSVGHKFKRSSPMDRGATAIDGVTKEADLAERVINHVLRKCSTDTVPPWAQEAWTWVKENNISDGSRPMDYVTRAELWTVLYRALHDDG